LEVAEVGFLPPQLSLKPLQLMPLRQGFTAHRSENVGQYAAQLGAMLDGVRLVKEDVWVGDYVLRLKIERGQIPETRPPKAIAAGVIDREAESR
jgi:hypothetical protein